jgi:hypothetical protein
VPDLVVLSRAVYGPEASWKSRALFLHQRIFPEGPLVAEPRKGRQPAPLLAMAVTLEDRSDRRPPETPRLEARLWGIPAALCFITRGDVPVHAAAVEVDGSAILFAAPGRHGKTTLASAFVGAGHRLLSEDVSCCRVGERPAVLPGPAMLRVRRDSYEHLEIPGTYPVMEDPDRVHLAVDESLRGDGSPVPIRAVIFLQEEREWELEPVPVPEAIRDLWTLSLKLPNDADRTRCFESLADLARRVPVYNLYRHLDFDRLEEDVKRIAEIGSG